VPPKKRATPKPPAPPEPAARGRATKGPRTPARRAPAERGRHVKPKTPAEQGRTVPAPPPERRPVGTKDTPGLLARAAKPKEGATYHRWVLAEFIGALVLAVLGGVLSPRKRADGTPTWVHLIVQLTAICGVFFVLALLSAGARLGKIAAAFGGLVLLGVLFNSADAVRKMAAVFAPTKKTTATSTSGTAPTGASAAAGAGQSTTAAAGPGSVTAGGQPAPGQE
jgi:hypothetical protein